MAFTFSYQVVCTFVLLWYVVLYLPVLSDNRTWKRKSCYPSRELYDTQSEKVILRNTATLNVMTYNLAEIYQLLNALKHFVSV